MTPPLPNSHTRDLEALLHPYANSVALRETDLQKITRGEGERVIDDTGRGYIEGMAGLWCAGLGFSDSELIDAAKEQMDKLPYYHLFGKKSHELAVELEFLARLAKHPLDGECRSLGLLAALERMPTKSA